MASWVQCACGNRIHTNLFAGAQVYRLIKDEEYDRLESPGESDAASRLFLSGREVFRCAACSRLIVFWERSGEPRYYVEESVGPGEPSAA